MTEQTNKQTYGFEAEVKQVLHLMIHALYSNKEIFLRELISNASDAADKLRFEALANPFLTAEDPDLKVRVSVDKEAKTISIRDNGIGMSREEVIGNLGTIAKSGTREFLNRLTGDKAADTKLIGQFGVGFYASFIVADRVVVTTRRADLDAAHGVRWISSGEGTYELETVEGVDRGTEIILHLKADEEEFLNEWRLKHIITKYSDHLTLPVLMKNDKGEEEIVNRATALWALAKQEITDEQYKEFYKHIAHDFEDPLLWTHNKVEGKLEYTALLYVPARAPFDLWHTNKTRGLKLYIKRVFIMEDAEQFLPHYLRFMRGVIDSNDLPLNISREVLQHNRIIDSMRSAIIKRVLSMLEQLATEDKEKYEKFWKEFGQALKEGPGEDFANKEQIAKLLRFASTLKDSEEQIVSLEDYIARMPGAQNKIYYVTAETFNAARHSPHLEIFRKKGIEVLLFSDRIDEWLMTHLTEFQGKSFQSVARGGLDLGELGDQTPTEVKEQQQSDFSELLAKVQELLKDAVKEVRLSQRLTDSPACVVLDEQDLSGAMERLLKASGQPVPTHKPILELNPDHSMVVQLKAHMNGPRFEDWAWVLLDQAILAEGGQLSDPALFVRRFNQLLLDNAKN